jgi:hypothetical protein
LVDDWHYEWCEEREDKDIDLVLNVLNKIRQDGDLFDCFGDRFHDFVVPFNDWVDLFGDSLHLACKSFRLTGRNTHL